MKKVIAALVVALALGGTAFAQPSANQLLIRINEVDADQSGTDAAEYVELLAPAGTDLTNILVVFHNGSAGFAEAGYRVHNMDGQAFPATPVTGGTRSLLVLGPTGLAGFTSQAYNTLYTTGFPATNAVQNGGSNEGDGVLVAYDGNNDGAFQVASDTVIDKFAYVGFGSSGTDGGSATNVNFKAIYGGTGSTYLVIDGISPNTSMGKTSDTIPPASGLTWDYTGNNANNVTPSPGELNTGQSSTVPVELMGFSAE